VRYWAFAFALCVIPPAASSAAGDLFNGDWKLDQSKSKAAAKGPQVQSVHIEADETHLVMLNRGTNGSGEEVQWAVKADFGGKMAGVFNSPDMDAVLCFRSDARTILLKLSREAVTTGWRTLEVSKNGKTLKVTTAIETGGKESKTVEWFDKQ
jgi:hypothetical protein